MKEKDKHILINSDYFEEFEKVAKQYNLTNKALLEKMISYFKATKKDPREVKEVDLNNEIKGLTKRIADIDKHIISFIKTQEKEILKPIRSEVNDIHQAILVKLGHNVDELKTNKKMSIEEVREDIKIDFDFLIKDFKLLSELVEKKGDYGLVAEIRYGILDDINKIKERNGY